jgi:hypothetical protein
MPISPGLGGTILPAPLHAFSAWTLVQFNH